MLPSKDRVGYQRSHANSVFTCRSCSISDNTLDSMCLLCLSASQSLCSRISYSCLMTLLLLPVSSSAKDTMPMPSQLPCVLAVGTSVFQRWCPRWWLSCHCCQRLVHTGRVWGRRLSLCGLRTWRQGSWRLWYHELEF